MILDQEHSTEVFPIRGHHLKSTYSLLLSFYAETQSIEDAVDITIKCNQSAIHARELKYQTDLLGENNYKAESYWNDRRNLFRRFLELPDNYPALIVESKKDKICELCTIGSHCTNLDSFGTDTIVALEVFGMSALRSMSSEGKFMTTIGEVKRKLLQR